MDVYLYTDHDNDVFEVFATLKAAKAFAEEQAPDEEWDNGSKSWGLGEYIHIYKRKIRDN